MPITFYNLFNPVTCDSKKCFIEGINRIITFITMFHVNPIAPMTLKASVTCFIKGVLGRFISCVPLPSLLTFPNP